MTRTPSANFTRPADTNQYASGDLVANNTTAASVTPMAFTIDPANGGGNYFVRRARIKKSNTSLTSASFRLHLYKTLPTCSNGDNGAWLTSESEHLGSMDVTMDKAYSDGAKGIAVPNNGSDIGFNIGPSGIIYGLIEARNTYTPASAEVFTVTLEVYSAD